MVKYNKAFTITETMIALVILTVGCVAISSSIIRVGRVIEKNARIKLLLATMDSYKEEVRDLNNGQLDVLEDGGLHQNVIFTLEEYKNSFQKSSSEVISKVVEKNNFFIIAYLTKEKDEKNREITDLNINGFIEDPRKDFSAKGYRQKYRLKINKIEEISKKHQS